MTEIPQVGHRPRAPPPPRGRPPRLHENFLDRDTVVVGLVVQALLGLITDARALLPERKALAWR
jgi:hypothetical protein